jgi:DNA-3-methyladenine glycosylase
VNEEDIVSSPRIGVDYAGEHAEWHYRFYIRHNPYVSGKKGRIKDEKVINGKLDF